MLSLLCRALTPAINLADTIKGWAKVRHQLAEPPRRRASQREEGVAMLS